MEVVQMGHIKTLGGEVVTGMIVEASIDELQAAGSLLYRKVKVVPLENAAKRLGIGIVKTEGEKT